LNFGVFENLREPLKYKVTQLDEMDRFCSIGIDEMSISDELVFNKREKRMREEITLSEDSGTANNY